MPFSSVLLTPSKKYGDVVHESASSHKLLDGPPSRASTEEREYIGLNGDSLANRKMTAVKCQTKAIISPGTDDEMTIYGYRRVFWRWIVMWICVFITGGLFGLVMYWRPDWKLRLTHKRVQFTHADSVLIKDNYKEDYIRFYVKPIRTTTPSAKQPLRIPEQSGGGWRTVESFRWFRCQKLVYIWSDESESFHKLEGFDQNVFLADYHAQKGISAEEQALRRFIYGGNEIIVPLHSIPYLLVKEVLNPFYVFQIFSVCLWFSDEYYYYAAAIVVMSAGGIISAIVQTKTNERNLHSTIQSTDVVSVCRGEDVFEDVSTESLVPGDVFVIPSHGCELHCDALLLTGNAIVNEAMLTGESVPVTKITLPKHADTQFDPREHSKSTLFCGTNVIQTRYYGSHKVLAVVIRTGFLTAKGNLVRSIMYPAPVDFKFEQDSYKFVGLLALIAGAGFIYTCIQKALRGLTASDIALDALDLITIVVPPALPATMTIGSLYAQKRLKKKGIFCISPRTINVSGSIDCICFDKTGTLTEDGLDLWGIVPSNGAELTDPVKTPSTMPVTHEMIQGMATCHSLTIIEGELAGDPLDVKMFEGTTWTLEEPSQDSTQQFDTLAPTIVRPKQTNNVTQSTLGPTEQQPVDQLLYDGLLSSPEIGIIRQFPFSSSRQRMSVVVRVLGASNFTVFCKGSPEMIASLSLSSTVPENFHRILEKYTLRGYRVIALAKRDLPRNTKFAKLQRIDRADIEKELEFLGLIILENRLKTQTKPVIQELQRANLRTIMVTGDNILTALSVARECDMIPQQARVILVSVDAENRLIFHQAEQPQKSPLGQANNNKKERFPVNEHVINMDQKYHFAITGPNFEALREHHEDYLDRIITRGAVFARMSPEQKQQLIEHLQELGYYVGMCGDGANDCGALKAAHAGISLSDAESSVASPFTAKEPYISCVPELIREGRCALVTSFGIFKYMAAYSLTQFTSVLILYDIESNLSDIQFLYIDLFLISVFAVFFGITEAYPGELAKHPPMKSLISLAPISSLVLQLLVIVGFQTIGFSYVQEQDWFIPYNHTNPSYEGTEWEEYFRNSTIEDSEVACWENYSVFTISAFQYIILAYAFSKAKPYRKTVFSNYGLLASLVFLTGFTIYLVLYPTRYLQSSFETLLPPVMSFRLILLGLAAVNIVLCVFLENVVVENLIFKTCRSRFNGAHKTKRRYLSVDKELSRNSSWPPISDAPIKAEKPRSTKEKDSPLESFQVDSTVIEDENTAFEELVPGTNAVGPTEAAANHTSAAVTLNPPPYSPTRPSSSSQPLYPTPDVFSTPTSHTTTPSHVTSSSGDFVSCDSILLESRNSLSNECATRSQSDTSTMAAEDR